MTDSDALDALAAALAPRLLREVRRLIEAEADDDNALGVATLAEIGYVPRTAPKASLTAPRQRPSVQHGARAKKR